MRYSPVSLAAAASAAAIMLAVSACSSPPPLAGPSKAGGAASPSTAPAPRVSSSPTGDGATAAGTGSASASNGAPSKPSPSGSVVTESSPPGDIPDNQAFVAYAPAGARFSVKFPEGWATQQVTDGTLFTDKLNAIHVSSHAAAKAPTVATTRSVTVPHLQSSEPMFALTDVTAGTRRAGAVVVIHYARDSAMNEVTGKVIREDVLLYEFFNAGTEVDLTLSGPAGADNVDPWRIVTDSLKWLS